MSEEGFLRRWARRKIEVREGREPPPEPAHLPELAGTVAVPADPAPQPVVEAPVETALARPLPTMEDVATLDKDSDFSTFVARGVDQAVRRSALKKLFADPHFNVMDRLDVYIDDYTQASPMSEKMLASLDHAKSVFAKMLENEPQPQPTEAEAEAKPEPQHPPEQETQ
jgi:hypothetical protein